MMATLVLALAFAAQSVTPPSPDSTECKARIEAELKRQTRFEQYLDAVGTALTLDPREVPEETLADATTALLDVLGLCTHCDMTRRAEAEALVKEIARLKGVMCKPQRREAAIFTRNNGSETVVVKGPLVLAWDDLKRTQATLQAELVLKGDSVSKISYRTTYGDFSCGFIYRNQGGKLFYGTARPENLNRELEEKNRSGLSVVSAAVCRD